jgi:hypothetical protein
VSIGNEKSHMVDLTKYIRPVHPRVQRRRALAASLHIPPELGAKFTDGGRAVLKIVCSEAVRRGACTLKWAAIADLASVSYTVVNVALHTAKAEGLIEVERSGRLGSTITLAAMWKAWLDLYGDAPPDGPR